MKYYKPSDVSAVVCTMNSISGIEECLLSLRNAGVGEIVVVDAHSTDGTLELATKLSDIVLEDPGIGLGNARNIGIAVTTKPLILNMGSDNVLPAGELEKMISYLEAGEFHGVSAQTRVLGSNYVARGLNHWRQSRFPQGEREVIGTPTLFQGDLLRMHPYNPDRKFSDDSELCERWQRAFNSTFAISDAVCFELGKSSLPEARIRARMYGVSDCEVFRDGKQKGWSLTRKANSLLYPFKMDFITPLANSKHLSVITLIPFFGYFTAHRYQGWIQACRQK